MKSEMGQRPGTKEGANGLLQVNYRTFGRGGDWTGHLQPFGSGTVVPQLKKCEIFEKNLKKN